MFHLPSSFGATAGRTWSWGRNETLGGLPRLLVVGGRAVNGDSRANGSIWCWLGRYFGPFPLCCPVWLLLMKSGWRMHSQSDSSLESSKSDSTPFRTDFHQLWEAWHMVTRIEYLWITLMTIIVDESKKTTWICEYRRQVERPRARTWWISSNSHSSIGHCFPWMFGFEHWRRCCWRCRIDFCLSSRLHKSCPKCSSGGGILTPPILPWVRLPHLLDWGSPLLCVHYGIWQVSI